MIALVVVIICLSGLLAQHRAHSHAMDMHGYGGLVSKIELRLSALERSSQERYSHAAFEELKTKVDALRIAQGMKASR